MSPSPDQNPTTPRNPAPPWKLFLWALTAAPTGLALDALLIRFAYGLWVPPTPFVMGVYAVGALILATASTTLLTGRRGAWADPRRGLTAAGLVLVGLQAFGLWERMTAAALPRQPTPWLGFLAVIVAVPVALFVVVRIGAARERAWLGVWIGALVLSTLLIGNRNVVGRPISTRALLFDVACLLSGLVLLILLRSRGRGLPAALRPPLLLGPVVLAAGLGLHLMRDGHTEPPAPARPDAPHLVFLVLDTMRGDVFQDVLDNTPEGARLRTALGPMVWFSEHTAVGPATPTTMSSVWTGLYPGQHGVGHDPRTNWLRAIHDDVPLLAEILRDDGYETLAFVANSSLKHSIGVHRGFSFFSSLRPAEIQYAPAFAALRLPNQKKSAYETADRARRAMVRGLEALHVDGRPALLWFHLMDTHTPLVPHPELPELPTTANLEGESRLYHDAARFAASELALAVEQIETVLERENTVLFLLADHGEMLLADGHVSPGTQARSGHGHSYFDSVVRVPLGIRIPGLDTERSSDEMVTQVDLVPTVLDLLDLDAPGDLPGCSLTPVLRAPGSDFTCRSHVVSSANSGGNPHHALRTPLLKVMLSDNDRFEPLLFELAIDPGETTNLAAQRVDAVASAAQLVEHFRQQFEENREGGPVELDPETEERLRALGYLD